MIFVTGILGHTGTYFIERLIAEKFEEKIRVLVRETSDISLLENSDLNYELIYGDLNDPSIWDKCMKNITQVVHIYNIHYSPEVVESAIRNNVERVILVHTTGIYSKFKDASQEYIEVEKNVKKLSEKSISITILRPTMIYGDMKDYNMSKFIKLIDKLKVVPVIDKGQSLLQPVYAKDLGNAYYEVLMNKDTWNRDYNLSGNAPITMNQVYRTIAEGLNKKIYLLNIPMGLAKFAAKTIKVISFSKLDLVEKVERMGEDRSYSNEEASLDFNFTTTPFQIGIKEEIAEYAKMRNKTSTTEELK